MKRLGALEALGRGLSNVHANLQTIFVSVAGSVLLLAILVASLVPWIAALGIDATRFVTGQRASGTELLELFRGLLSPEDLLARLGAGLLALLLGVLVASAVYCWYYGGLLGVLVAGDAQAPAGPGRGSAVFRTWSWRFFLHESTRLAWRVMVYLTVVMALLLVVLALFGALLVGAALVSARRGAGAAFAVGCGGSLPLLFALLTVYAAGWLGQGALPGAGGPLSAVRRGYRVLGRRLGACLGMMGLFLVAGMASGMLFGLLNLFGSAFPTPLGVSAAVNAMLFIVQLFANAYLSLVFHAAGIALLRSESAGIDEARAA